MMKDKRASQHDENYYDEHMNKYSKNKLLERHMDKNQIDEFIYICLHCHVYDYIINQLYILHTFMYMISLSLY